MAEASAGTAPAVPQEDPIAELPPQPPEPPAVADEAVAAAERIAFLALASELARGRNVLVVDDGASALTGVAAHLDSAEMSALDGPADGTYELVVADLIVADDSAAFGIGQLSRIVGTDSGIALVRFPNRPEFAPLIDAFNAAFARTLTMRQHNWVASALLDDAMFANDDPSRAVAASVRKMAAAEPGEELYNVIVGANGAFPDFRPQLAMTRSVMVRELIDQLQSARERAEADLAELKTENADQAARIRQLEEELAWYDENKLAVRETVESRGWAKSMLAFWSSAVSVFERARRVLR